jgi:hypothetical protein
MPTGFLNADLDLTSRRDLRSLAAALADVGMLELTRHRRGRLFFACFEINHSYDGPEACARLVLRSLERLDPRAHAALAACSLRELNLGFEAGSTRIAASLSRQTIARLAALGLGVGLTIYPPPRARPAPRSSR